MTGPSVRLGSWSDRLRSVFRAEKSFSRALGPTKVFVRVLGNIRAVCRGNGRLHLRIESRDLSLGQSCLKLHHYDAQTVPNAILPKKAAYLAHVGNSSSTRKKTSLAGNRWIYLLCFRSWSVHGVSLCKILASDGHLWMSSCVTSSSSSSSSSSSISIP